MFLYHSHNITPSQERTDQKSQATLLMLHRSVVGLSSAHLHSTFLLFSIFQCNQHTSLNSWLILSPLGCLQTWPRIIFKQHWKWRCESTNSRRRYTRSLTEVLLWVALKHVTLILHYSVLLRSHRSCFHSFAMISSGPPDIKLSLNLCLIELHFLHLTLQVILSSNLCQFT